MIRINGDKFEIYQKAGQESDDTSIVYYLVKRLVKDAGLNLAKITQMLNGARPGNATTPQNLSNKLGRDTLRVTEFIEIVNMCGYDISFELHDAAKKNTSYTEPQKTSYTLSFDDFSTLVTEDFTDCQSINFKNIVIAGARAKEAAQWVTSQLTDNMDIQEEVMMLLNANREFNVVCKPIAKRNIKK